LVPIIRALWLQAEKFQAIILNDIYYVAKQDKKLRPKVFVIEYPRALTHFHSSQAAKQEQAHQEQKEEKKNDITG
jgi:hypothetical protein